MASTLDRLRAQRESSVEVEPGKTLTLRRPTAAQMPSLRGGISVAVVAEHVTGWNLTQADILGAAIGSSDPEPFNRELVSEVLADRPEWLEAVTTKLIEVVTAWWEQRAANAKN